MLLSCFTLGACSSLGSATVEPTTDEYPVVSIFGIKEKGTTDTAIENVEAALSEISIRKYGVKVNLVLLEEEEYAPVLFSKVATEMGKYNTLVRDKIATDETDKRVLALKDVDYTGYKNFKTTEGINIPSEVTNSNLDIFLVYTPKADSPVLDPDSESYNPVLRNGGMFNILYEQRALFGLTNSLTNDFAQLKSSAYPEALKAVTRETYESLIDTNPNKNAKEDVYGIPNNIVYGGYEFIMFDNEYVSKVWSENRDKADLYALKDGKDSDALTALVKELNACKANGEIAEDVEVKKVFSSYQEFNDYVSNGGKFCVGLITGDISVKDLCAQSGRYEIYTRTVTAVSGVDLYESMFCISPSTRDSGGRNNFSDVRLNYALQVLTLLNTDKDFRNIFQYGVRDTHYSLGRDGVVHITGTAKERYIMDPLYCGNNFIIYPSDRMDEVTLELAKNNWTLGKKQVKEVLDLYNSK